MRRGAALLLALAAAVAAGDAGAQAIRPSPGLSPGRIPPAPVAPRAAPGAEAPTTDLRARFGVDVATRLLRSTDADERLRGVERAAATRTPEALALLERVASAGMSGGYDPRAPPVDGAARQDPRAMLVVVRALATWTDKEPARAALEALLSEPGLTLSARAGAGGAHDPAADEADGAARVLLARQEAAIALAESGNAASLETLVATARSGKPGQEAALDALAMVPPVTPVLGGVTLTTPGMVALAARLGDLRSLAAILGAVHASDPSLRAAAVAALGLSGDARALEIAREAAKDKDARVRVAGGEALAHLAASDAAAVVELLVADDATARDGLRIARNVRAEGVTKAAAARAAASADPELRSLAVVALGRQTSPAAVTALSTLAADPRLAGDAADALARSPSPAAMGAIEAMAATPGARRLAGRAYFVRRAVRGERSARGDALLASLAASGDGADRALGIEALVALGERGLKPALEDRDPRVRRAAAMGSLGLRDSAQALTERLAVEQDETTRYVLAAGLREGDPAGVVPTLVLLDRAQAGGPDAPLAALALARRADEDLAPKVDGLLASHDPVMRAHVARGLAGSLVPDATGRLARAYTWEAFAEVRRALVEALARRPAGDVAAPSVRDALELAARLDPDRVTRAIAQRARDGREPPRRGPEHEVVWLRIVPAEGAVLPREMTGTLVDPDGLALPVAFDEDGYALVPGVAPGDARLRLAPRLPAYEAR